MSAKKPFRLVHSKEIYRGRMVRLVKDRIVMHREPDRLVTRELVEHPGAVVVIPYIDKRRILLIRQFRYAAKGDLWEVPAGTLDPGEDPLRCAKRELEEETGFRARKWKRLTGFFPAPGVSNEWMTLYRADALTPGKKNLDVDEWIEHKVVPVKQALQMSRDGRIRDAKTLVAVLWALL